MEERIEIISGGPELLDRIEPLWEELKIHHAETSVYFSEEMRARGFETGKNAIASKAKHLRVDIAIDLIEKYDIAYQKMMRS